MPRGSAKSRSTSSKASKSASKPRTKNVLQQMGLKKDGGIDRRRKTASSMVTNIVRKNQFDIATLTGTKVSKQAKVDLRKGKKHTTMSLVEELTKPSAAEQSRRRSMGLRKDGRIDRRTKIARSIGLTNHPNSGQSGRNHAQSLFDNLVADCDLDAILNDLDPRLREAIATSKKRTLTVLALPGPAVCAPLTTNRLRTDAPFVERTSDDSGVQMAMMTI
eukprot:CAMPEP_0202693998 /NCGR_PEP_ID=MMETSP1385-20130828/7977_1 /ASSEMBLY_ACC=CAM_ASM_000861 /TAXON_ID=933848 /ORGANISM="Elphidium margaritaceum" /LENGTH=218 /DNA_ID=CAMNT_0049349769 /DNA_START=37 /DNA_END=694 /DNA_ORIENTATION=+